jgi:hypothetical protein
VALAHGELAHGDALRGEEVQVLAVLHGPAGRGELAVDLDPRPCLGSEVAVSGGFRHRGVPLA